MWDKAKNKAVLLQLFSGYRLYFWIYAGLFLSYLIFSPFVTLYGNSGGIHSAMTPYDGDGRVKLVMAALLSILLIATLLMAIGRRMTAERLITILIAAGIILRFGYMLYTPFYIRGHDVREYNGYGHLAYIFRLFNLQGLPVSNLGQFYHPPLAHIADAATARLFAFLTGAANQDVIFESTRLIPCFASIALLFVSCRLFDELDFSKRAKLTALAVIAFHPTFILLSASINNDMLMLLFFMTAFLYSIRWYKDPTYKNIILLALSIGCAMSTKFSGALAAIFTAMIFLLVLIRKYKTKKIGNIVLQLAAFAAVCLPLGLWYHIRNLKLFGQVLGYVAPISAKSQLYVGNIPFAERFLSFSLPGILKNVWCDPFNDFGLWAYTVKSALFGEYTFSDRHEALAVILILSSLVLIVLSIGAMIWFLIADRKKNRLAVLSFFALWSLLVLSFIYFNIKYPFGCTMDFRYIVPTVITGAAFLGLLADRLTKSGIRRALFAAFVTGLSVFCASAAVFYLI